MDDQFLSDGALGLVDADVNLRDPFAHGGGFGPTDESIGSQVEGVAAIQEHLVDLPLDLLELLIRPTSEELEHHDDHLPLPEDEHSDQRHDYEESHDIDEDE